MLIRIVRMTFRPEAVADFQAIFNASKAQIRAFPGCRRLELLRDLDQPHVFCTYSHWDGPEALEAYRQSELFESTWAKTKALFAAKAVAFSVERVEEVV
ncbi:putative quinol monooxygenase [Umezakia ovalisporum]|uniref:Antibiotic biosynthesis monooxygenase n=1 Tax=Umezakia ovalisporum FSS-43 TaxID=2740520 RepID=A0ABT6K266_9CYAN|nr:putative quinol monooxygenase [Umezakia ovalisporum]MDH6056379.1 antibiotic biosynthesis monooxygenase [Umezakia ovalisporum FSS-43]